MKKLVLFSGSHLVAGLIGFVAGIYFLPILTAPPAPATSDLEEAVSDARFTGQFRRDLKDSDALHWGEGTIHVGQNFIVLEGELAPGPDYKLYLSPRFVETEADFALLKSSMVRVGDVRTFENFSVPLTGIINPEDFNTVIVWCESFSQFITAAQYQ